VGPYAAATGGAERRSCRSALPAPQPELQTSPLPASPEETYSLRVLEVEISQALSPVITVPTLPVGGGWTREFLTCVGASFQDLRPDLVI